MNEYLRTKQDDVYSVSVILFQLMFLGKLPNFYDESTFETFSSNNNIWNNLNKSLQILFEKTFKKYDRHITLDELIKGFHNYKYGLKNEKFTKELFPKKQS